MNETLASAVAAATPEEAREAVVALEALIARAEAGAPEPGACPRCGCPHFVRKGRDSRGRQAYLCKGCGRTFTSATMGLLANSRLPPEAWREFARCQAEGASLREAAARCGVSYPTAWYMRMRLCEAMARDLPSFSPAPGEAVELDGTLVGDSMSGNHGVAARAHGSQPRFEMPREARGRGGASHARGVSGELICVECGATASGAAFARVVSRGRPTGAELLPALRGNVASGSTVDTDGHSSYGPALRAIGGVERRVHDPGTDPGGLSHVNSLHSRLKAFLARFNGVSTRRLSRYVAWFVWTERSKPVPGDRREVCWCACRSGTYSVTRRELFAEPHPYMEYFARAA